MKVNDTKGRKLRGLATPSRERKEILRLPRYPPAHPHRPSSPPTLPPHPPHPLSLLLQTRQETVEGEPPTGPGPSLSSSSKSQLGLGGAPGELGYRRDPDPAPPKKSCADRARNSVARVTAQIRTDCRWFCKEVSMIRSHVLLHCNGRRPQARGCSAASWSARGCRRALLSEPRDDVMGHVLARAGTGFHSLSVAGSPFLFLRPELQFISTEQGVISQPCFFILFLYLPPTQLTLFIKVVATLCGTNIRGRESPWRIRVSPLRTDIEVPIAW